MKLINIIIILILVIIIGLICYYFWKNKDKPCHNCPYCDSCNKNIHQKSAKSKKKLLKKD